ncbi:MAG: VanZ family protein [Chryseobacterium sp.]|nr:VanZ family protein [Chryseobacterium sp.]
MKKLLYKCYPALINVYTVWILYLMFFVSEREKFGESHYLIRAVPFESIHFVLYEAGFIPYEMYKNILGNIVLFIPYGFLRILYPKLNNYKYLFFVFFIVINILEFSQYYFNLGYAEFDDVMLNTIGMTIGYLIYKNFFFIKDK